MSGFAMYRCDLHLPCSLLYALIYYLRFYDHFLTFSFSNNQIQQRPQNNYVAHVTTYVYLRTSLFHLEANVRMLGGLSFS